MIEFLKNFDYVALVCFVFGVYITLKMLDVFADYAIEVDINSYKEEGLEKGFWRSVFLIFGMIFYVIVSVVQIFVNKLLNCFF